MRKTLALLTCLLTALVALVPPLAAQTPPLNLDEAVTGQKGGVTQMALAQELFAQGMRLTDAALVIVAAKLAQGVTLTDVAQERVAGEAAADPVGDVPVDAPADAGRMLAEARRLAGDDEVYLSLLDEVEAPEAKGRFGGASRQASALAAGASEGWRVPFFGESYAEVAVTATAPLQVVLTDAAGNRVWCPSGPQMNFHCGFAPRENGYFTITVANPGAAAARYDLLTN